MADTASLKEILFRHSAEQCKVCEAIPFDQIGHQIEYEKFKMLHEVIEEADLEDNTDVIVCFYSGTVTEMRYWGNGIFQGIYEHTTKVIAAWMPLPEPYKEEE